MTTEDDRWTEHDGNAYDYTQERDPWVIRKAGLRIKIEKHDPIRNGALVVLENPAKNNAEERLWRKLYEGTDGEGREYGIMPAFWVDGLDAEEGDIVSGDELREAMHDAATDFADAARNLVDSLSQAATRRARERGPIDLSNYPTLGDTFEYDTDERSALEHRSYMIAQPDDSEADDEDDEVEVSEVHLRGLAEYNERLEREDSDG